MISSRNITQLRHLLKEHLPEFRIRCYKEDDFNIRIVFVAGTHNFENKVGEVVAWNHHIGGMVSITHHPIIERVFRAWNNTQLPQYTHMFPKPLISYQLVVDSNYVIKDCTPKQRKSTKESCAMQIVS